MQLPDWLTNLGLPHYLAAGGGLVVLLALLLYCTPASRLKMPGIILGILGGMGVGAALGVVAMAYYENQQKQSPTTEEGAPSQGRRGGPPMMGPGGGGPNSKAQLAALVAKLDVLTHGPLEVKLNAEQQKKVREQLRKLDELEDLSEDDAKARLDALLDVLKDQRSTLEAAGYRWPGQGAGAPFGGPGGGGGRRGSAAANPFKEGENGKHLKALQSRLEKK